MEKMQLDDCDSRRVRGVFNPRSQKTPIKETKENLQNFRKWLSGKIRDWDGSLDDPALKSLLLDFECAIHILKEVDPTYLGDENASNYAFSMLINSNKEIDPAVKLYHTYIRKGNELRRHKKREPQALEKSVGVFNKAKDILPTYPDAYYFQGHAFFELKWWAQALHAYDEANEKTKTQYGHEDAFAVFYQGLIHLEVRQFQEALHDFSRAVEINPIFAQAWMKKGQIHYLLNQNDEAIMACDNAVINDPELYQAWLIQGHALIKNKRLDEALSAYSNAIKNDPKNAEAWLSKASVFIQQNKVIDSIAAIKKALVFDPGLGSPEYFLHLRNEFAVYIIGRELFSRGNHVDAIKAMSQATTINPSISCAWFFLASSFFLLRKYDEALVSYSHCLKNDPKNTTALLMKSLTHFYLKQYKIAIEYFDRYLLLNPKNHTIMVMKGDSLCSLNRFEEAIKSYDDCLMIDPNNVEAKKKKDSIQSQLIG